MKTNQMKLIACALIVLAAPNAGAQAAPPPVHHDTTKMDPKAKPTTHNASVFGPDAKYDSVKYDYQAQLDIYGAKHMNPTQRPLLELGREMYQSGPLRKGIPLLGPSNRVHPQILVYGDFRTAAGNSSLGGTSEDLNVWSNRINLEVDFRITATERIHALFRPLEKNGKFTGIDFSSDSASFESQNDFAPSSLFFEGDLGAMLGGLGGKDAPFDLPFSVGLMPLVFQNGIWMEDAFTGAAFSIPAKNSAALGWSNFDFTFFFGMDRLTNPVAGSEKIDKPMIAGMNAFIEANKGYWEAGYAYLTPTTDTGRVLHSAALSFTRRYGGRISNSWRYIGSFAQEKVAGSGAATDKSGHLFLLENSLITKNPTAFVPYLNLFYGLGSPVSAARDPGAGGILKNTGLNFEGDALTAFPSLDPTASDAAGGALGLNMLGSKLNNQIVLEVAAQYPTEKRPSMPGVQYAAGIRGQRVLNKAMLVRIDAMFGKREGLTDIRGARLELRYKF
jgi:hypothetical protein